MIYIAQIIAIVIFEAVAMYFVTQRVGENNEPLIETQPTLSVSIMPVGAFVVAWLFS